MTLDAREVERAARAGEESRVRELLKNATEAERRACARELKAFLSEADGPGGLWWGGIAGTPAFGMAAVGLAGGAAPAYRAWQLVNVEDGSGRTPPKAALDGLVGILRDRNPPWLADFADRMVREQWARLRWKHWQVVRDLVRHGLIGKPDRPEYTTAMVAGIYAWASGPQGNVLTLLRADRGLLDDEVWRLFSVPEAGAELDCGYTGWEDALVTLAAEGEISRDQLLDACLDTFIRDFPPNHVGWYLTLHDQLAPSRDEKAARAGKYAALLSATSKTGVTLGQRECGALLDAGLLDPRTFLAASTAALLFPQKSAATAQLKLIGALIKAHPDMRDEALATAAAAFQHPREDVQAAALTLIKKHGVPAAGAARAAIESLAAALSPVIMPEAASLGLAPATGTGAALPVRDDEREPAPSLRDRPLDGVEDPGALVRLLARLIEDASDALAVERAVAGAVRLASLPLAERARLAGPLLKRAREQSWGPDAVWLHCGTEGQVALLTIAWATAELHVRTYPDWMDEEEPDIWPPLESRPDPADWDPADPRHGVLDARLWEACHLIVAGPGGPLLAEPEFADGTISQATLAWRLARWRPGSGGPPRNDVESALLRLALDADEAFWQSWDAAPVVAAGEAPSAQQARAMYDEGHVACEFEPVFVPASEARRPEQRRQPPRALGRLRAPGPGRGPDGDPGAGWTSRCWRALAVDPADPERGALGGYIGGFGPGRDLPLLLPHQPELVAANLILPLSDGLASGRSHPAAREAAECLPAVGVAMGSTFGRMCHLALVTAMASASADTRIAAASAWAQVALDGRLDPGLAAAAITDGVSANVFKLNRIAEGMGHAALDPAATAGIAAACLAASASLLPAGPPGLHLLLELAARCVTAIAGPVLPPLPVAIADLAASRDRTKLGEAARRLARLVAPALRRDRQAGPMRSGRAFRHHFGQRGQVRDRADKEALVKLLLTDSGITNLSIHNALVDLLGKPIAESSALCIPTASYGHPEGGPGAAWRFITGQASTPMCELGWKSLGVLELTALTSIDQERWVPMVQEADALLAGGGDATYLCYWMRQSGLANLLPSLRAVWVGLSGGSMVMTPSIGADFVSWSRADSDAALGVVDFAIFPHLDYPDFPENSMASAEKWAASMPVPSYAIDRQTAIKVTDGSVEVVSEGHWKLFTS